MLGCIGKGLCSVKNANKSFESKTRSDGVILTETTVILVLSFYASRTASEHIKFLLLVTVTHSALLLRSD